MAVATKVKFVTLIYSPDKNPTTIPHKSPSDKPVGRLFIPVSSNDQGISCLSLNTGLNPDVSADSWDLVKDVPCIAHKVITGEIMVIAQSDKLNPLDELNAYSADVLSFIINSASQDKLTEWSKTCKSARAANLIKHKLRT